MFDEMLGLMKDEILSSLFRSSSSPERMKTFLETMPVKMIHNDVSGLSFAGQESPVSQGLSDQEPESGVSHSPYRRDEIKVGRNDPCPCGSGKKYKKCCGAG